jgi:heterodisulfide reductase subunit B
LEEEVKMAPGVHIAENVGCPHWKELMRSFSQFKSSLMDGGIKTKKRNSLVITSCCNRCLKAAFAKKHLIWAHKLTKGRIKARHSSLHYASMSLL